MVVLGLNEDDSCALLVACEAGVREATRAFAMLLRTDASDERPTFNESAGPSGLGKLVSPHDDEGIGVSFTLSGAVGGNVLLFLSEDAAFEVASRLLKRKIMGPDERALAALSEVGNILASAFLNGIARFVKRACLPSIPGIAMAPARVLLTAVPVTADQQGLVSLQSVDGLNFSLCFIPDPPTVSRLVTDVRAAA